MTRKRGTITIDTRVRENPGEFRVGNGILFCNSCDHSVDWKRKSTIDDHLNSKTHKTKKFFTKINNINFNKHLFLPFLPPNQRGL